MFTKDTKYQEILAHHALKDLKLFILDPPMEGPVNTLPSEDELSSLSLEEHAKRVSAAWNPDSMAEGISYVAEQKERGILKKIELYADREKALDCSKNAACMLYLPVSEKGPFALVCAGGSYLAVANMVEAFPVAKRLNELGIGVFVLRYRAGVLGAARKSGEDLRNALNWILSNTAELNITNEYAIFGFSAGGHLTAEFGTSNQGYRNFQLPKPAMLCLGYPFLSYNWIAEDDPLLFCMSDDGDIEKLKREFSPLDFLDTDFPKSFIWQTAEDELVPYDENGLELFRRLQKLEVPCRLKEVAHGLHGLGLGTGSEAEGWVEEAVSYWRSETD